jgi:hypothetical protein
MKRQPGLLFTYEKEPEPTMENFREPRGDQLKKERGHHLSLVIFG